MLNVDSDHQWVVRLMWLIFLGSLIFLFNSLYYPNFYNSKNLLTILGEKIISTLGKVILLNYLQQWECSTLSIKNLFRFLHLLNKQVLNIKKRISAVWGKFLLVLTRKYVCKVLASKLAKILQDVKTNLILVSYQSQKHNKLNYFLVGVHAAAAPSVLLGSQCLSCLSCQWAPVCHPLSLTKPASGPAVGHRLWAQRTGSWQPGWPHPWLPARGCSVQRWWQVVAGA